jgi:hypothetical protein
MRLVGGPRDGEPISLKDGDGKEFHPPVGFVLQYQFGPIDTSGQQQVQLRLSPPNSNAASTHSQPGYVETYLMEADGNWHYYTGG